jgi:hypothetical protein
LFDSVVLKQAPKSAAADQLSAKSRVVKIEPVGGPSGNPFSGFKR